MRVLENNAIEDFRKRTKQIGSSYKMDEFNITNLDILLARIGQRIIVKEVVFFCDPRFLRAARELIEQMNLQDKAHGVFEKAPTAVSLISEFAMRRGDHDIYFVGKTMNGALLVPYIEDEQGEEVEQYSITLTWG